MAPASWHTYEKRLVLSVLVLQTVYLHLINGCHQTFVSRAGGPQNGTFTSPAFVNPTGRTVSCVYTFLGGPGQRVLLSFTKFNLRGTPPDGAAVGDLPACVHEFMDLYAEVAQPELSALVNSPFGGRYCGPITPRARVSLHRALAFSFHSDKNASVPELFTGVYKFVNDSEYEVGTPVGGGPCNFLVKGAVKRTGNLVSPTYPGAYPKNLHCSYQFLGSPAEYEVGTPVGGGPCNFLVKGAVKRTGNLVSPTYPGAYPKNLHCSYQFLGSPAEYEVGTPVGGGPCNFLVKGAVKRTGNLVSPTYPGAYPKNLHCSYQFLGSPAEYEVGTPVGGGPCNFLVKGAVKRTGNLVSPTYPGAYPRNLHCSYQFLGSPAEYEVGTPVGGGPCNFLVKGAVKRTGNLVSPTYPGAYPKNLHCSYQFLGSPGQRIRLEFRDFDLFFGGPHCPFDYVRVHDGADNTSAVIGTYCGQQRNLVIYSSEASLYVTFVTLGRTANTQNRGFKGIFEFSNSFTKLDFISKNDSEHILGTECDQRVLSKSSKGGAGGGAVFSPNYPFPYMPKLVCRYFIYGMQSAQHLERVRLEFDRFEIPFGPKGDCSDGYLKIYLKGQETMDAYDKFDHELCGPEAKPTVFVSDGPRLLMVFSSGEIMGRGFKAKYTFETEYRIPGTAAPDGACSFTYRSEAKRKGDFNSPRYPSNYPARTDCSYHLMSAGDEQVVLVFDNFKVRADNVNSTTGSYGTAICQEDWLEVYNVYRDGSEAIVGRYCHQSAPGPVESNRGAIGLKVLLHSDALHVSSGFKARYSFEPAKSIFGDCGANVSSSDSGTITSPNYPDNYDAPRQNQASKSCNWYISVRPGYQILIVFEKFAVEGQRADRGCPAAVLRIWTEMNAPPIEVCGEKPATEKWQYISGGHQMRLSFITADKAVGAQGFKARWTEVRPGPSCDEFQCEKSLLCVPHAVRCDREPNCGADDDSDEAGCEPEEPPTPPLRPGWVVICGAALLLLAILCAACHRKRRRRRRRLLARQDALRRSLRAPAAAIAGGLPSRRQSLPSAFCEELGERYAASSVDSV